MEASSPYVSDESGRNELYVRRFPSGEGRSQISTNGIAVVDQWQSFFQAANQ